MQLCHVAVHVACISLISNSFLLHKEAMRLSVVFSSAALGVVEGLWLYIDASSNLPGSIRFNKIGYTRSRARLPFSVSLARIVNGWQPS